jgi:hypothetical protein
MKGRSISFGWSIWCARAGQLFDWGISPQGDFELSGLDENWYYQTNDADADYLEEYMPPANINCIDGDLVVRTLPALTFHVWVGIAIYWIRRMGLQRGRVSDGMRTVSVILSDEAESIFKESEVSLSHSVKAIPGIKCTECPYEFFCQFLREVAYEK